MEAAWSSFILLTEVAGTCLPDYIPQDSNLARNKRWKPSNMKTLWSFSWQVYTVVELPHSDVIYIFLVFHHLILLLFLSYTLPHWTAPNKDHSKCFKCFRYFAFHYHAVHICLKHWINCWPIIPVTTFFCLSLFSTWLILSLTTLFYFDIDKTLFITMKM
jgi:hypothetical protein